MKIIRARDYQHLSRQAANILSAQVILKPDSVLGLATGSSPIGTYQQLIAWEHKGDVDFRQVSTVNLDEYVGLPAGHPQSYAHFMRENFFDHIQIDLRNTHIPNGMAEDGDAECRHYDATIRQLGGIDLQLLGLGPNGHIGFNEPEDVFQKDTHRVALTDATIQANKRFFRIGSRCAAFRLHDGHLRHHAGAADCDGRVRRKQGKHPQTGVFRTCDPARSGFDSPAAS